MKMIMMVMMVVMGSLNPQQAQVTSIDKAYGLVNVTTQSGDLWTVRATGYCEGETLTVLMDDMGTEDITDDQILAIIK